MCQCSFCISQKCCDENYLSLLLLPPYHWSKVQTSFFPTRLHLPFRFSQKCCDENYLSLLLLPPYHWSKVQTSFFPTRLHLPFRFSQKCCDENYFKSLFLQLIPVTGAKFTTSSLPTPGATFLQLFWSQQRLGSCSVDCDTLLTMIDWCFCFQ
jgi:hypothetical protein